MIDQADSIASELEALAPEPSGAELTPPPSSESAATHSPSEARPVTSQPGSPAAPIFIHAENARDRFGRAFDPNIHPIGVDGKPLLTLKGELRLRGPRGGGATPRARTASYVPPVSSGAPPVQATPGPDPRIRSTAEVTVGMIALAFAFAGGEAWKTNESEREQLTQAWVGYYSIRGMVDLPPELMIATAYGAWISSNPERLSDTVSSIKSGLVSVGLMREPEPEEPTLRAVPNP